MNNIKRDGSTVYELNAQGVNRWNFSVQPGHTNSGGRLPNSLCEQIAMKAQISMEYHNTLLDALREVLPDLLSSEMTGHLLRYDGLRKLLSDIEEHTNVHNS